MVLSYVWSISPELTHQIYGGHRKPSYGVKCFSDMYMWAIPISIYPLIYMVGRPRYPFHSSDWPKKGIYLEINHQLQRVDHKHLEWNHSGWPINWCWKPIEQIEWVYYKDESWTATASKDKRGKLVERRIGHSAFNSWNLIGSSYSLGRRRWRPFHHFVVVFKQQRGRNYSTRICFVSGSKIVVYSGMHPWKSHFYLFRQTSFINLPVLPSRNPSYSETSCCRDTYSLVNMFLLLLQRYQISIELSLADWKEF